MHAAIEAMGVCKSFLIPHEQPSRLKERVDKAVSIIQDLRRERDALKAELAQRPDSSERLEQLERERTEIRNRIESVLSNLESLE